MVNYIVDNPNAKLGSFMALRTVLSTLWKTICKIDEEYDHIHICLCIPARATADMEGVDYKYKGRVGADLFKEVLPQTTTIFTFVGCHHDELLFEGLRDWGAGK